MKPENVFSLVCGLVLGLFFAALFNEKVRIAITTRSPWMANNPRGYMLVVIFLALAILGASYILTMRHV